MSVENDGLVPMDPQWEITGPVEIPEGDVVVSQDEVAGAITGPRSDADRLNAILGVEPSEDDVWQPVPNRASRRRFLKQWGQHKRSRNRRGHSRKVDKKPLKVTAWLS